MRSILYIVLSCSVILVGCSEYCYEPALVGDAPSAPGEVWKQREIVYPNKVTVTPFDTLDLCKEISVSELLDIALYNNPTTRSSWNASKAAAYNYRSSLSTYYPVVAGSSTITIEDDTVGAGSGTPITDPTQSAPLNGNGITSGFGGRGTGGIYTFFNQITASWLLFDFGGRNANAELALQTLYQTNWQHNYAMQQVMLSVLTNYASYVGNHGLVEAFAENLKDTEVLLKAAQTMRNAGLATLTDVLQAQSLLEQAKLNLQQALGDESTSLGELLITLGLPPTTKLCLKNLPLELPVVELAGNLDGFLELALRKRPDIGAAIANIKQQEANLVIATSAGLPTVSANAMLSRMHFFRNSRLDGHDNSLAIGINVPLFQGFYYLNQERQAKALIHQSMADLDIELSLVASQVVTNYYAILTAITSLPSSEAALEFSQRAYRGYLAQYKVGTSSLLDVINALITMSNSRAQLVITRTQWATSLANLAFSVGILEENAAGWREGPPDRLTTIKFRDK